MVLAQLWSTDPVPRHLWWVPYSPMPLAVTWLKASTLDLFSESVTLKGHSCRLFMHSMEFQVHQLSQPANLTAHAHGLIDAGSRSAPLKRVAEKGLTASIRQVCLNWRLALIDLTLKMRGWKTTCGIKTVYKTLGDSHRIKWHPVRFIAGDGCLGSCPSVRLR